MKENIDFKLSEENMERVQILCGLLVVDVDYFMKYIPDYLELNKNELFKDEQGLFVIDECVLLGVAHMIIDDLRREANEDVTEFVDIYTFSLGTVVVNG